MRKLGQGAFGAVFLVEKDGQKAAVKIGIADPDGEFVTIDDEVKMQEKFHSKGLAPAVLCHSVLHMYGHTVHSILMDTVDFTLNNLLCKVGIEPRKLRPVVVALMGAMLKMREEGFTHGDMHSQNIGFKKQPNGTYKLQFIDFGQSSIHTHDPVVDVEQLVSELFEIEKAPQAPYFAKMLQWFITHGVKQYADYMVRGTRGAFEKHHERHYEPHIGLHKKKKARYDDFDDLSTQYGRFQ
jgi:tRNA A-37 threonylcarbamoyl transferase component Bud32